MTVRKLMQELLTLFEAGCADEEVKRVNKDSVVIYVKPEEGE